MGESSIEWTDATWNPVRGCSVVGPECTNCYAMGIAARFSGQGLPFEGFAQFSEKRRLPQWTNVVRLLPDKLEDPLRWREPRRIFVNSMSDLFHERLPREAIAAVLGVMCLGSHHTYQVLTKRSARMRELLSSITLEEALTAAAMCGVGMPRARGRWIADRSREIGRDPTWEGPLAAAPWAWFGVSVGIRAALPRLDDLRATPAAVRFVSFEPLLEDLGDVDLTGIDWAIVGGESGDGARPFDLAWGRSLVEQCERAGVACFVKQLGARPFYRTPIAPLAPADDRLDVVLRSKKGGSPHEWPADLRVREYPAVAR